MLEIVPLFENYNNQCLIIVDVQEPFKKWWIKNGKDNLPNDINDFCLNFNKVYQIWDDHDADKPSYTFNNQVSQLKKHYGVDHPSGEIQNYEEIFDGESLDKVLQMEKDKIMDPYIFLKKDGNYAVLVNGSHKWFFPTKELVDVLRSINEQIVLVGGAEGECLKDIEVLLRLLNKDFSVNNEYTYNAIDVD